MPERRSTGRPAKYCDDPCRKAAERKCRAAERLEAEGLEHREYLLRVAAERQRAAVELVALITEDPQAAVTARDRGCRSFATHELQRLHHEISAGRRNVVAGRQRA